jgi:hypothetical protein
VRNPPEIFDPVGAQVEVCVMTKAVAEGCFSIAYETQIEPGRSQPNYCNLKSLTRAGFKGSENYLSGKQFSDSDAELQPRILLEFSLRLVDACEAVRCSCVNSGMGRALNGVGLTLISVTVGGQRSLIVVVRPK